MCASAYSAGFSSTSTTRIELSLQMVLYPLGINEDVFGVVGHRINVPKAGAVNRGIVVPPMEHAPLRPVPARPAGPIDPAAALREVSSWLPALSPLAVRALALVVLAEQPRPDVASALDVSEAELAKLLAEARKELRQTIVVLGGSGWCERAEGLISDRLDGALADRDIRRLDVHLRNCARCVEHERRLVQATDALVRSLGSPPAPVSTPPVPLVEAPEGPTEVEPVDGEAGPVDAAPADDTLPIANLPPVEQPPPGRGATGGRLALDRRHTTSGRRR